MAKLWQKGSNLNEEAEKFTVGNDFLLDAKLLKYDCKASIAHAKMLLSIGILDNVEYGKIESELNNIIELDRKGKFKIRLEDEDCHTAIENHLAKYLGDVGKKIHTARSRNDQVVAALRLFEREELYETINLVLALIKSLKKLAKENVEMPGFTHTRKAMPSSLKIWVMAFIEALQDGIKLLEGAKEIINKNPLGTAAGYGVPLEIDKDITKNELSFGENFSSPLYAQNSRGKYEGIIAGALSAIMLDLNKLASDIILFSMDEFSFFSIPEELTTGSSIMPHKKNPDVLELIRAKYHVVLGYEFQLKSIVGNLISGYHRDLQITKEPLIKSFEEAKSCLRMMSLIISGLVVNKGACKKACTKDIYATEKVYELVKKGIPFREAYGRVKEGFGK